jgi:hypothetical protein
MLQRIMVETFSNEYQRLDSKLIVAIHSDVFTRLFQGFLLPLE